MPGSQNSKLLGVAAIVAAVTALSPAPALAAQGASDWLRTEFADVRLVSAVAGTDGIAQVPLGLEFRLAEGWKVYWKSAGDAGYPPQVDWAGSGNLAGVETDYPVPHRFSLFGLETFGYKDHVVYPMTAALAESGAPLQVSAAINALACSDICVPLEGTLTLAVPSGPPAPTAFTQLLDRWRAQVPRDLPGVGLTVSEPRAEGDPASPTLAFTVVSDAGLEGLDVFPDAPPGLSFGKPAVQISDDGGRARVRLPVGVDAPGALDGARLSLVLVAGDRFVVRPLVVEGATVATGPAGGLRLLLAILGVAALGGLILNLMPCVLPVLSLKLVSVVGYGGAEAGTIRRGFLASAAGIVFSFLVLAAAAIGLKAAGVAVGWGIQFQQPVFLTFMMAVVTLFAANLWGLYEVPLPRAIADAGARLSGGAGGRGLAGHFLTGAFATLLATPCSAPFLGTAVAFALSAGPGENVAVFAAMGLGMALPYLAVAAFPALARGLPRPGAWMLWVKRVMGLALAATAAWLLWVLSAQTGTAVAAAVGAGLLALVGVLAAGARLGNRATLPAGLVVLALVLVFAGTAERVAVPGGERAAAGRSPGETAWRPFEPELVAGLVADGRVVLVDVTADWCLTCKVNKRLVLDAGPVADLLSDGGVVPVRADWTNPDPAIAGYLASFGRYGIPFNAVYGPAAPDGIALPELLTTEAVLDAVERAGSGRMAGQADSGLDSDG